VRFGGEASFILMNRRLSLTSSIVVTLVASAASARSAEPPAGMVGTWEVERVESDRADQMRWEVRPQDPQLLGRELVISKDEVRFSEDKGPCKRPSWKPTAMTWGDLFGKGFQRPGGARPTPADFEFTASIREKITAYVLCPDRKSKGSDLWLQSEWLVLRAPDTLVMHQDSQVLLILKRRPADAKPRASFPCDKATTPTERAICGSFSLAGWDRSVAAAYTQALERSHDHQDKIREEQKAWLRKRDACGDRVSCIDDLLWRRVDDLKQD
jgi:uncharacterized protein YecT (DUF1311 family)